MKSHAKMFGPLRRLGTNIRLPQRGGHGGLEIGDLGAKLGALLQHPGGMSHVITPLILRIALYRRRLLLLAARQQQDTNTQQPDVAHSSPPPKAAAAYQA